MMTGRRSIARSLVSEDGEVIQLDSRSRFVHRLLNAS
jgi:hypothetical protein